MTLIHDSFLTDRLKKDYIQLLNNRYKRLFH